MRLGKPWALTFTTRITLIFGALGLLALLVASVYAARTSQAQLNAEIANTLEQRHRTVQSLVENRLDILNTYLGVASFNHSFASLIANESEINRFSNDMSLMFQDSESAAMLDLFFLLSPDKRLIFDGGMPLYDSRFALEQIDSPILFTTNWRPIGFDRRTALIKATPIFDPATIQLKGYMVAGLAIGQNRYFIQHLMRSADVDHIAIHNHNGQQLVSATRTENNSDIAIINFASSDEVEGHSTYQPLNVFGQPTDLFVSISLRPDRFLSPAGQFVRSFLLLSGIFLSILAFAGWLLHLSHSHAIARLLKFIDETQKGMKGCKFEGTGITEYNRVGKAMQHMVDDLNVAATVFESGEGMIVADVHCTILRVNQAFTRITGYEAEEITRKHLTSIKIKDDKIDFDVIQKTLMHQGVWQDEIWSKRKSGDRFLQWTSISAVFNEQDNTIVNYVVTLLDVTDRKEAEIRIRQLAFYDQLTMLPNRQLLMERLEHALERSQRSKKLGAILYSA